MVSADRIVLWYPADLRNWGRNCLDRSSFRTSLNRVHETARAGDTWTEFVGVDCCGSAMDVPLRVERVDGGPALTDSIGIEYVERAECPNTGGWRVQSADGPVD